MSGLLTLKINLDRLLYNLFCAYALSLPFELTLEQWFGIDTIFKPFRILSLLIIGIYVIRGTQERFLIKREDRADLLLYGLFFYGILISLVNIIGGIFSMSLFYNSIFQSSLYLLTFFIFKTLPLTTNQLNRIMHFFVAGISINALYILFQNVVFMRGGRLSGFVDNPNYVALGIVAAITWFFLRLNKESGKRKTLMLVTLILSSVYVLGITGSRTGLLVFLIANLFVFLFASLRMKLILISGIALILFVLIVKPIDTNTTVGPLVIINRVNKSIDQDGSDVRFTIWKGAFRMMEDQGYGGIGIGQFRANFPRYYGFETDKLILEIVNRGYFLSTHNDYLAILVDYGLPGLVLYLWFLVLVFRKLFVRLTYPEEDEQMVIITQFSFIIICCLVVFGLTAENFQHHLFWFLLMFSTKSFK